MRTVERVALCSLVDADVSHAAKYGNIFLFFEEMGSS